MNKNRETKGITLIALVITIIILLIIAGVTITQLVQNGLLGKAKTVKEKTIEETAKEEIELIIFEVQAENEGEATLKNIVKKLQEKENSTYIVTTESRYATLTVSDDGKGISSENELNEEVEKIYITNLEYNVEVKVTKELNVSVLNDKQDNNLGELKIISFSTQFSIDNYRMGDCRCKTLCN